MPKIPQVIAGPTQLGGPARPEDAGSGLGTEALAQASKETAQVTEALFNEEMESRVSGAVGRAARELNTLQHEVGQIPDHNERTAVYAKKSQKIISGIRESLTFPKFQGRFGERIEPTLERGRMSIAQGVRQSQIDTAKGERLLKIETDLDLFANATNQGHRKQIADSIKAEIDAGLKGGLWSAATAAKMKIAAENRMEGDTLLMQSQVKADSIADLHAGNPEAMIEAARKLPEGRLREMTLALVNNHITTDQKIRTEKLRASNHKTLSDIESGEYDGADGVEKLLAEGLREGREFGETQTFLDLLAKKKLGTVVARTQQSAVVRASLERMHDTDQELFFGDRQTIGPGGGDGIAVDLHSGNWSVDPTTGDLQPDPEGTTLANLMTTDDRSAVKKLMDAGPASAQSADQKEVTAEIENSLRMIGFLDGDNVDISVSLKGPKAQVVRRDMVRAIDSARGEKGYLLPGQMDTILQVARDNYMRRVHARPPSWLRHFPRGAHWVSSSMEATSLAFLSVDQIDFHSIPVATRVDIAKALSEDGRDFHHSPENEDLQRIIAFEYLRMLRAGTAE